LVTSDIFSSQLSAVRLQLLIFGGAGLCARHRPIF
jgi:hypothetical protein